MQLTLALDGRATRLAQVNQALKCFFGPPALYLRLDPVSQLVMSLIGGKTRSEVSLVAYLRLQARFEDWSAARDAPVREVVQSIRDVTFAEVKAPRLQAALAQITQPDGTMSLEHLRAMSVREAHLWLESLPGVGRKVAAAVLNFSTLRKKTLVIDSHHLRILRRLQIVDMRADVRRAHETVMPLLPQDWQAQAYDDQHVLMKRLGQAVCCHRAPICRQCPLQALCPVGGKSLRPPKGPRKPAVPDLSLGPHPGKMSPKGSDEKSRP